MIDKLDLLKLALTGALYDQSSWATVRPRSRFRQFIVRNLEKRSYKLMKVHPYDAKKREQGLDWPSIGFTMIGLMRLDNIRELVKRIADEKISGDLLEAGVWRGGCSIFMRACLDEFGLDRTVWVADSFEGMPKPSCSEDEGYDLSDNKYLAVSLEQVKENFERFGLLDDNVQFLKGWFSESLPKAPIQKLALLRIDGDLYESTMDVLTNLYGKINSGGFVIIDDYYTWEPCRRAVLEFRTEHKISAPIIEIDESGVYWRIN